MQRMVEALIQYDVRSAPVAKLQKDINEYCNERFEELCAAKVMGTTYCIKSPVVARYGPDEPGGAMAWRCYKKEEINDARRHVGCVDNCGNVIQCIGEATPSDTFGVAFPEMNNWIQQRKQAYCSSYQLTANAMCSSGKSGGVARYDHIRRRWICFDPSDVALDGASYCADNCGGPVPCAGGLVRGELPQYTLYVIQHTDMESAFEALWPCESPDDICMPRLVNPPQCLTREQTVALQSLSAQQMALQRACQEAMDEACREGTQTEECYGLWLARYDVGGVPKVSGTWKCYPVSHLDFTRLSNCIDGCGNLIRCQGRRIEESSTSVDLPQLTRIASDPTYCSAYQKAGNAYCSEKHGSGWVARQNCNSYRWECFSLDHMPSTRWVGCAGHCGEFILCPSSGTGDAEESGDSLGDEGLEDVISNVPDPCLDGQLCEGTAQAPPYCSGVRPNPYADAASGGYGNPTQHGP
ncbi:putative microneme protein [Besnoitia besnoiti]|uniref:Putative microneme protein n=1 Tax=Besnoitia besnoiti TaxID=94643 RepID=A0A2A9M812_BESBE|nr:putative microneme protein [Besnoitia besnoiti]PFH31813.1 putative microneme protein [Besnoitia besnoiti]